jgi:hypothetical protein
MKLSHVALIFYGVTSFTYQTLNARNSQNTLKNFLQNSSELEYHDENRDKKNCTENKLCTIISTLNTLISQFKKHDARVQSDFDQLFSDFDVLISKSDTITVGEPQNVTALQITTMSKIDICCQTLDSKIDIILECGSIPISQITTITSPGSYCLTTSLNGAGPLITIASNNVLIDLNGQSLNATSGNGIIVDSSNAYTNITLKNGTIYGTINNRGISIDSNTTNQLSIKIENIEVSNFIGTNGTGVWLNNVTGLTMSSCHLFNNGANVLIQNSSEIVLNQMSCTYATLKDGAQFVSSNNISVQESTFNHNFQYGIDLNPAINASLVNSTFNSNGDGGLSLRSNNQNIVARNCDFSENGQNGISATVGILENGIFTNCTASLNGNGGFLIVGSIDVTVQDSNANQNHNIGFTLSGPNNALLGCTAINNAFGIRVAGVNSLVKECVAIKNTAAGIGAGTDAKFLANCSQGNGATPAVSTGDTNYYATSGTTTFTAPNGPGLAPFYQVTQHPAGTSPAISYWDNITLPS